ncbi:MAG: BMC domain-containing protein [Lachnospiraceae bacterium]
MDIRDLLPEDAEGRLRIIQETVPGKQITLAHVVSSPKPIVYRKLGLNPNIDFERAAIGIITMTPSESAIIASDIAIKTADVYLGFVDRFSGTLIITGRIASVEASLQAILQYFKAELGFAICKITKR